MVTWLLAFGEVVLQRFKAVFISGIRLPVVTQAEITNYIVAIMTPLKRKSVCETSLSLKPDSKPKVSYSVQGR